MKRPQRAVETPVGFAACVAIGFTSGLCGGTAAGTVEALYVLGTVRPVEYGALVWAGVAYGLLGGALGLLLGLLAGLAALVTPVRPARAASAVFAAVFAGFGAAILIGRAGPELPGGPRGVVIVTALGALFVAWLGGHLVAKTALRVLARPKGALGAWLAGLVVATMLSVSPAPRAADEMEPERAQDDGFSGKPDIVLVVVSGLRADAVGAYGAVPGFTPNLDGLAREGVVFEQAIASSAAPGPALASLLTAVTPSVHGVTTVGDTLPEDRVTLAEVLRDGGYVTGGVPNERDVSGTHGFEQGFDWYVYRLDDPLFASESASCLLLYQRARAEWEARVENPRAEAWYTPASPQLARARAFLDRNRGERVFLMVELADPRFPWFDQPGRAPLGVRGTPAPVEDGGAAYAAEVQAADDALGAFFGGLRAEGRWDEALVVVTSDFGMARSQRAHPLTDEAVRVPLVVKLPGGRYAGTRVPWQVRAIDVAPTVLDTAGFATPEGWQGVTLFDDWFDDDLTHDAPWPDHPASRPALSELRSGAERLVGVRSQGWKVLRLESDTRVVRRCFDLRNDPGEGSDRWDADVGCRRADLADALLGGWPGVRPPPRVEPEEEASEGAEEPAEGGGEAATVAGAETTGGGATTGGAGTTAGAGAGAVPAGP